MKKIRCSGNFFLCLLIDLLFNLEWSIPAWILLVMHYCLGWPLWCFFLALGLWVLGIIGSMAVFSWLARLGNTPNPYRENRNPYSVKERK